MAEQFDRAIDPLTGDYVDDGAGGMAYTRGAETALHHALRGRPWHGSRRQGSRLHELGRLDVNRAAARAPREIERACAPLIDDGLLRSVKVRTEVRGSRVLCEAIAVDVAGADIDVGDLTPFGGR